MQDLLIIHMSTKVKDTVDDGEIVTDLFPYVEEGKDLIVFGTTVGSKPIVLKIRRPTYSEEVDLQTIESLMSMNDAKKIGVDQDGDVVYAFLSSEKKANEVRKLCEKPIDKSQVIEIGDIANLITDMASKGAAIGELEVAIRYSQDIIDAYKKGIKCKRPDEIINFKKKYQGKEVNVCTEQMV